jgi:hypothetical protein
MIKILFGAALGCIATVLVEAITFWVLILKGRK